MPRGVLKSNLPSKICETCQKPFTWRKVWERCWDDVKTCSDRCKSERKKKLQAVKRDESRDAGGADGYGAGGGGGGPQKTAGPPVEPPAVGRQPQQQQGKRRQRRASSPGADE